MAQKQPADGARIPPAHVPFSGLANCVTEDDFMRIHLRIGYDGGSNLAAARAQVAASIRSVASRSCDTATPSGRHAEFARCL